MYPVKLKWKRPSKSTGIYIKKLCCHYDFHWAWACFQVNMRTRQPPFFLPRYLVDRLLFDSIFSWSAFVWLNIHYSVGQLLLDFISGWSAFVWLNIWLVSFCLTWYPDIPLLASDTIKFTSAPRNGNFPAIKMFLPTQCLIHLVFTLQIWTTYLREYFVSCHLLNQLLQIFTNRWRWMIDFPR